MTKEQIKKIRKLWVGKYFTWISSIKTSEKIIDVTMHPDSKFLINLHYEKDPFWGPMTLNERTVKILLVSGFKMDYNDGDLMLITEKPIKNKKEAIRRWGYLTKDYEEYKEKLSEKYDSLVESIIKNTPLVIHPVIEDQIEKTDPVKNKNPQERLISPFNILEYL